jgi:phosphoribosylformylglycinamidine synthase
MLGVLDDLSLFTRIGFESEGDLVYLVGESVNDIAPSQYLASYHGISKCPAPHFDINKEYDMHQVIKQLIREKLVASVHDVADGGLYVALFESALVNKLGFDIECDDSIRKDAFLFGEAQGRVVVSVKPELQEAFVELMATSETEYSLLGTVTAGDIKVDGEDFGTTAAAKEVYDNVLHAILGE